MGVKINPEEVAAPFRAEIKKEIQGLIEKNKRVPKLVGLLANSDPAARKYAEWTGKACSSDGINYELRVLEDSSTVEDVIAEINEDDTIDGLIVYYPVFGNKPSFFMGSMDGYLRDTVAYMKDVEGLSYFYRYNLYRNVRKLKESAQLIAAELTLSKNGMNMKANPNSPTEDDETLEKVGITGELTLPKEARSLLPCTPLACVKVLEHLEVSTPPQKLKGKTVTIINRSEIVGHPLAAMLANDGAKVYSVDLDSVCIMENGRMKTTETDKDAAISESDVLILGVPSKNFKVDCKFIQPNTTVINVASFSNVDEAELLKIEGVKFVAMVGKVTIAMLERNLLRLYKLTEARSACKAEAQAADTETPSGFRLCHTNFLPNKATKYSEVIAGKNGSKFNQIFELAVFLTVTWVASWVVWNAKFIWAILNDENAFDGPL